MELVAEEPTPRPVGTANGKEKRVSRACISCRMRKTRCDLNSDGVPGRPPCRRCLQEQDECVLATSRRGGRRTKNVLPPPPGNFATETAGKESESDRPHRGALGDWSAAGETDEGRVGWRSPQPSRGDPSGAWRTTRSDSMNAWSQPTQSPNDIESHITSADLYNPSDALDLLAQVADRDAANPSRPAGPSSESQSNAPRGPVFPPISDGFLSSADASQLINHYHEKYHPYFPVAYKDIFDHKQDVLLRVEKEPHLLTAVLTVASKDEPSWARVHEACSAHMESLVSKLIYRGSTTVGAVEALLILAEWAPQRPQDKPATIGRGEEDQGAWMHVGVAIRLGYLQRLEQTGLLQENMKEGPGSKDFGRKRLAWAACYMSDRQVSIRLGKGFWSRGPAPPADLRSADFPSLETSGSGSDSLSLLFQAHLELTQLFSNAHDILYSSPSHREHICRGGEYVRYIDDFSSVLRKWKLAWGSLGFTPHVKATLTLSYDFLRLYINAFAFQATINRAIARARQTSSPIPAMGPLFLHLAGTPDARFIYESIDAANSLLGTLNGFIDPLTGLRYMPLKYYLYVIYAAVFLFKARLAGAIGSEASGNVRRAINVTVDRLYSSSVNPNSLGHRYARSLDLLWRKSPGRLGETQGAGNTSQQRPPGVDHGQGSRRADMAVDLEPLNVFSWRDLDSLGEFITNSTGVTDDVAAVGPGFKSGQAANTADGVGGDLFDPLWSGNDVIF